MSSFAELLRSSVRGVSPVLEAVVLSMLAIVTAWAGVHWFRRLRRVLLNRRRERQVGRDDVGASVFDANQGRLRRALVRAVELVAWVSLLWFPGRHHGRQGRQGRQGRPGRR